MLKPNVLNIMVRGIKVKLNRGEDLEEILETYVNLSPEGKDQIREAINGK